MYAVDLYAKNQCTMKPLHENPHAIPVIAQVKNDLTSWVGHRKTDHQDIVAGQTFIAPKEGNLDAIEVFSAVVSDPGRVTLKLHVFDAETGHWGPMVCASSVEFDRNLNNQWVSFDLPPFHLHEGDSYGFMLESENSFIGVGEAIGCADAPPYREGREWKAKGHNQDGEFYNYFSLAFKVDIRA